MKVGIVIIPHIYTEKPGILNPLGVSYVMTLEPGSVAIHGDEGGSHVAVVLGENGENCEALFFTSNPRWSERSRRATRDELAMAGYVQTKPTYLAFVIRPVGSFEPTGLTYPESWVSHLRQEFNATLGRVIEINV